MKNSFKEVRLFIGLVLSCLVISVFASCSQPSNNVPNLPVLPVSAEANLDDAFLGTWENNDYGFTSTYSVAKNQIKDESMDVWYDVVSSEVVVSADGYTLVFCQIAEGHGTEWTPAGGYHVVALKYNSGTSKLDIFCPVNTSGYTSLSLLQNAHPSTYNVGDNISFSPTSCTKVTN